MNFYKKVGAGRPTEEEQMMILSIEKIALQNGIPENEIPECHNLEDLIEVKTLLDNYSPEADEPEQFIQEEPTQEGQEEPVINNEVEPEPEEPETINAKNENHAPQFIADDYDPFADPVIERSYTQGQTSGQTQESQDPDDEPLNLEDSKVKSNLDDLSPATKRRAAEQTADALLKGYARLVPQPFKWMSKFPEEKIEKMAFNGELDLSIEVQNGVTFDDYMRQSNEQLDEIFEVEQETLDEIKEPLIEVLMEQQLELTPTQRLTMAIISHLAQMFTVALKLRQQNNRILSYQKHLTYLSRAKSA